MNQSATSSTISLSERYAGALLGLACGDAVGTTVEFQQRGTFTPLTDMIGGGPFDLKAGQWTDDTSMALCLAESLITKQRSDPADQLNRYLNWWHWGYLSATGSCFDIGGTVRAALKTFEVSGAPFCGSDDPKTAGNGALMRLAPAVMFAFPDAAEIERCAVDSTRTTHGAPEAIDCSRLFAHIIANALAGDVKADVLNAAQLRFSSPAVTELASGAYLNKTENDIAGTGYCVASLEAALWCFHQTDSFESAVLRAANLGDDADTTAAIVGQIAGAHYGKSGIPARWLERLHMRDDIEGFAHRLGTRERAL
jgi:ADP-ribosyl-[dinitrogen reductase] hydrolase